jgi:hypothetical protein
MDATGLVIVHQSQYCPEEHCDLGSGDCPTCQRAREGFRVCGSCGQLIRPKDIGAACHAFDKHRTWT